MIEASNLIERVSALILNKNDISQERGLKVAPRKKR